MRKFFTLALNTDVAIATQGFNCFPGATLETDAVFIKRLSVAVAAQIAGDIVPARIAMCTLYGRLTFENEGDNFIGNGLTDIVSGLLLNPSAPINCNIYVAPGSLVQFDASGYLLEPAAAAAVVYVYIGIEYEFVKDA